MIRSSSSSMGIVSLYGDSRIVSSESAIVLSCLISESGLLLLSLDDSIGTDYAFFIDVGNSIVFYSFSICLSIRLLF